MMEVSTAGSDLKVLFVDDDENVLRGYQRAMRKVIAMDTCNSGAEALERLRQCARYSVIVTDMRMPGMDGVELLQKARGISPDTVRIMLTGNADQQTAVDAINEGDVFRFLNKPCEPKLLAEAILSAHQQYQHYRSERELLERTLTGAVHAMGEALALANPRLCGRISSIEHHLFAISPRLREIPEWQLALLPTLSQLGATLITEAMFYRAAAGTPSSEAESRLMAQYPEIGARIVEQIPRLAELAEATRWQLADFAPAHFEAGVPSGTSIPLMARALRVVMDFDALLRASGDVNEAVQRMTMFPHRYDPAILRVLTRHSETLRSSNVVQINTSAITTDMVIAQDVYTSNGTLLVRKGQPVSRSISERLMLMAESGIVPQQLYIYVVSADAELEEVESIA
ncbi:MAG: response regulator [Gammaproteobacteria bacterium]|nr:response regulator [Gammaproteobacteria bacterium]